MLDIIIISIKIKLLNVLFYDLAVQFNHNSIIFYVKLNLCDC